jgi:hypothetical protein
MKLKVIALSAATLGCGLLFSQPASAISGVPWQVLLQTTSESSVNAIPTGAGPAGLYGNPSTTNCTYSTDTTTDPCWNPLEVEFDITSVNTTSATPQPAVLGSLSDPTLSSGNILQITNSLDSSDGGVSSIAANFGCSGGNLNGNITVNQEDGAVFTFNVVSGPCDFSTAIGLTFSSTGGGSNSDAGNATLYIYPNSTVTGTYNGVWDNSSSSDTPFQQGGGGTSTIDLTINGDFTVTASAQVPSGGFGPCQTAGETFTTSMATSMGQGITDTVGGYATGGDVVATVADSDGDVLWLFGSSTDATGKQLTSGQLFFSTYVAVAGSGMSSCSGGIFWDAPFQKDDKRDGRPAPFRPRKHLHAFMPQHRPDLRDRKLPFNDRDRNHDRDADEQKFAFDRKNNW